VAQTPKQLGERSHAIDGNSSLSAALARRSAHGKEIRRQRREPFD
jgi:hypothetical protein